MEYQSIHSIPWQHGSFWVAVAIVIFAVLFARRIAAPLAGMLDARTQAVRAALDEAARLKAEAEAMLADAKARQAQAAADAKHILAAAHDEAERMSAELAAEAKATAARRERMALERINAAEKAAVNDVRTAAIDIATAAAAQLLARDFGPQLDAMMIDRAIGGLPAALRQAV